MTIGTANVNGFTVTQGLWSAYTAATPVSMASSAIAYLTDTSNNTYVRATALTGANAAVIYDLATPSAGGSAVYRVRGGFIWKNGDGKYATFRLETGTNYGPETYGFYNLSSASTVYTGWWSQSTAWASSDLTAMQLNTYTQSTALRYTKAWMEFDTTSTPAGTPSIAAVNTDRPTITWNFVDSDLGVQASAVVKVFSAAQIAAGGFNPSTSTPLWAGTVKGTAQTITPGTPIVTNGLVYRPWVQVFKNVETTVIPSTIASATTTYTASWTAPASPSIVTTWSSATARVQITTEGLAAPYKTFVFRGTALDDPLLQVLKETTDTDGTVITYDHFVPRSTAVVYGVYVTTGTVTPFLSSTATLSTVTTGTVTNWELRSVNNPATYLNTSVPVTAISFEQYEGQTVYRPIGSNYPVVVAGNIGGDDGTMTITTTNQTVWDDIKEILDLQSDLYLVSPFVDSTGLARRWFIRVTGRSWVESGVPAAQVRTATVSFVEVEAPEVAAD